jgi:hypothetical protein
VQVVGGSNPLAPTKKNNALSFNQSSDFWQSGGESHSAHTLPTQIRLAARDQALSSLMTLQKARDWVDLVLKLMSIAAIIAAGIWALYQFNLTETTAANIQLEVTADVKPYSANNKLLLIHVRPKNIGKVLVSPEHLLVLVRDLPKNLKPGPVELNKLRDRYKVDILDRYPDGYDLEPGVEYDEIVALIVPKETMYSIYGEVDFDEGQDEIDTTTVARVEQ